MAMEARSTQRHPDRALKSKNTGCHTWKIGEGESEVPPKGTSLGVFLPPEP